MTDRQLDLFGGSRIGADPATAPGIQRRHTIAPELDDDALIAAIPTASLANYRDLATEIARRRLVSAVPALEALCRRFRGLGIEKPIPEQIAALEILAELGGRAAAQAVTRLIVEEVVQGPGLKTAIAAASKLGASLPDKVVRPLLRHEIPEIRAGACCCTRPSPVIVLLLVELLDDLNRGVALEAACALGRMGRHEARPTLVRLLCEQPSTAVIDAVIAIADEECLIILGRIARLKPRLADAAITALEDIGSPRALTIAADARSKG
jgi:hypothetical protein